MAADQHADKLIEALDKAYRKGRADAIDAAIEALGELPPAAFTAEQLAAMLSDVRSKLDHG